MRGLIMQGTLFVIVWQGSPLGRPFGVFVERARVSMLGLVPSIAKAWRASDCMRVRALLLCPAAAPLQCQLPTLDSLPHTRGSPKL